MSEIQARIHSQASSSRSFVEKSEFGPGRGERILKMTIDPRAGEITVRDCNTQEISFEGSPAYGIAHEIEHLEKTEIMGGI